MYTHPGNPKISFGRCADHNLFRAFEGVDGRHKAGHERKWMPRINKCFSLDRWCSNYQAAPGPDPPGGGRVKAAVSLRRRPSIVMTTVSFSASASNAGRLSARATKIHLALAA
jgi:hypothetical protein